MTSSVSATQHPLSPNSELPPRRNTPVTTNKIRDSCQACALSKVKCHKEKPTCSRCARRGMSCQYFVTRRPGRKRDSGHKNKSNNKKKADGEDVDMVTPISPVDQGVWNISIDSTTFSGLPGSNDYFSHLDQVSLELGLPTPLSNTATGTDISSASNIFGDLLFPSDPTMSSTFSDMDNEFDQLFTSPMNYLDLVTTEAYNHGQTSFDIARLLIPEDKDSDPVLETSTMERPEPPEISKPCSPSCNSLQPGPSRDASVSDVSSDSNCNCLVRVLDLLKALSTTSTKSPSSSTTRSVLSTSPYYNNTVSNLKTNNPLTQAVVMENKEAIEAVSTVLQCSCTEDGYLLTLLSMILLRILGRYAAAARKRSVATAASFEKGDRPSSSSNDHESLGRIAAQLILGELHHMQRLVNQLSPRLKVRERGEDASEGTLDRESSRDFFGSFPSLTDGGTGLAPFSPAILNQLEKDLRKSLSSLSLEIINILRQS